MAESLPSVSVVIATYQRREGVGTAVEAVLADPAASEVIVLVDGSTDGTAQALAARQADEPRLRIVVTRNQGQMLAQRAGAQQASGDILLFLDDDIVIGPGVVSGHASAHAEQSQSRVVVGAMPVTEADLTGAQWPVALYAQHYRTMIQRWQADSSLILRHLWGGHLSIRRASWLALPPYPGTRPLRYHLDWELGLRMSALGLTAVYRPDLTAVHHQRRSVRGFLRDRESSAHDRIYVHELYATRLGPLPVEHFFRDCGPLASWVIRSKRHLLYQLAQAVLAMTLPVTSALHAYAAQRPVAIALASVRGAARLVASEKARAGAHAVG